MFSKFNSVDVAVPDIERALVFYRDVLGLTQMSEVTEGARGYGLRWVRLGLGSTPFMALLGATAPGPVQRFLDRRGSGMYQLSLHAPDLQAVFDRLKEHGIRVITEQPVGGGPTAAEPAINASSLFVHPTSAHGVLIEVIRDP